MPLFIIFLIHENLAFQSCYLSFYYIYCQGIWFHSYYFRCVKINQKLAYNVYIIPCVQPLLLFKICVVFYFLVNTVFFYFRQYHQRTGVKSKSHTRNSGLPQNSSILSFDFFEFFEGFMAYTRRTIGQKRVCSFIWLIIIFCFCIIWLYYRCVFMYHCLSSF